MANRTQFGVILKRLREAAGLTQKELAERSGLFQRSISHWEQGQREPMWSNVEALARALGVDLNAFHTDQAEAEPAPTQRGRPRKQPTEPASSTQTTRKAKSKDSPQD